LENNFTILNEPSNCLDRGEHFNPSAQGCAARATLSQPSKNIPYRNAVASPLRAQRFNSFRVDVIL